MAQQRNVPRQAAAATDEATHPALEQASTLLEEVLSAFCQQVQEQVAQALAGQDLSDKQRSAVQQALTQVCQTVQDGALAQARSA